MSAPLVYVDTSEVHEGSLEELRRAIEELVALIEGSEPQLLAYNVHLSDDGRRMTVVHVHADAASLDRHLEVAGPAFGRFADLIRLSSIRVFGEPSEEALGRLHEKARLLGCDDVEVQPPLAGFSRFTPAVR